MKPNVSNVLTTIVLGLVFVLSSIPLASMAVSRATVERCEVRDNEVTVVFSGSRWVKERTFRVEE